MSIEDIPSPAEQKAVIKEALDNSWCMHEGDTWYLVSSKWWRKWMEYVGYDRYAPSSQHPGPIDNSPILEDGMLQTSLTESMDYQLLPPTAWNSLSSWYGVDPDTVVARKVVSASASGTTKVVEVYPYRLQVVTDVTAKQGKWVEISRRATMGEAKKLFCELFDVEPNNTRVWDLVNMKKYALVKDNEIIEDARIYDQQFVLLEQKNADGAWPAQEKDDDDVITSYSGSSSWGNDRGAPELPMAVGLTNLGNTCFMNSGLQCLAHTYPLTNFFVSGAFESDLNTDNPLGTKGELATEYGKLLQQYCSNQYRVIAPRDFKYCLSRHAEQFAGYNQHDSQELLAYLLDRLHEDLNRVRKRPYVETTESNGRDDAIVAQEAWSGYLLRNQSIVVDHFQGQYRSTVTCPECPKVSVTFDPFMYLTLPLPTASDRVLKVHVVFTDGRPRTVYAVKVLKRGSIKDLKIAASAICGIPAERLAAADVYSHTVYALYEDTKPLDCVRDEDITFLYELEASLFEEDVTSTVAASTASIGSTSSSSHATQVATNCLASMSVSDGKGGHHHPGNGNYRQHYSMEEEAVYHTSSPLVVVKKQKVSPEHEPHEGSSTASAAVDDQYHSTGSSSRVKVTEQDVEEDIVKIDTTETSTTSPSPSPASISSSTAAMKDYDEVEAEAEAEADIRSTTSSREVDIGSVGRSSSPMELDIDEHPPSASRHVDHGMGVGVGAGVGVGTASWIDIAASSSTSSSHERSANKNGYTGGGVLAELAKYLKDESVLQKARDNAQFRTMFMEKMDDFWTYWTEARPDFKGRCCTDRLFTCHSNHDDLARDRFSRLKDIIEDDHALWTSDTPLRVMQLLQRQQVDPNKANDDNRYPGSSAGYQYRTYTYRPRPALVSIPLLVGFIKGKTTVGDLRKSVMKRTASYIDWNAFKNSDEMFEPFKLCFVDTRGYRCGRCSSMNCDGCELPEDDEALLELNENNTAVSVDWHPYLLADYCNQTEAVRVEKHESCAGKKNQEQGAVHLSDCLSLFTTTETLGADDLWYCPSCKEHRQATKKFDLWKTPDILIVHLKRFHYSGVWRDKMDTLVEFPLEGLDLAPWLLRPEAMAEAPLYDLYAVSNHFGGMGGGHYTAFCKLQDGNWYDFDDSYVSRIDESKIVSSSAYVLFYKRRST